MSSRNYTVTVNVKDGGMLKKLEAMQSGSPMGGKGGGTVASSGGGIFNRLQQLGSNQLLKLAGIGIGIGSLVALTVKSSGILQSSLKLWETSFMLVFKPFGDLIGLALRPLALMMLTYAIPFYKWAGPVFRDWGKDVGAAIVKDPLNAPQNILRELLPSPGEIALGSVGLTAALGIMWNKFIEDAGNTLQSVPPMLWGLFVGVGTGIWQKLSTIPSIFFGYLSSIGSMIWSGLTSIPNVFVGIFTGLATSLTEALSGIPQAIYDAIISWIQGLIGGGAGGISSSSPLAAGSANKRAVLTQAIADTLG